MRKIIERLDPNVPFGWTFRRGTPAKPETTISAEDAATLRVSGVIGKDGSVTIAARDAKPRALVLTNAVAKTAGNPNGKASAGGVAVSDATLREQAHANGFPTVLFAFPTDGTMPTADDYAKIDPAEQDALFDWLRSLVRLDDVSDDTEATL